MGRTLAYIRAARATLEWGQPRCVDTREWAPNTTAPHAIEAGPEEYPETCVIQRRLKCAHVESAGWQLEMGATGRSTPLLLAI